MKRLKPGMKVRVIAQPPAKCSVKTALCHVVGMEAVIVRASSDSPALGFGLRPWDWVVEFSQPVHANPDPRALPRTLLQMMDEWLEPILDAATDTWARSMIEDLKRLGDRSLIPHDQPVRV